MVACALLVLQNLKIKNEYKPKKRGIQREGAAEMRTIPMSLLIRMGVTPLPIGTLLGALQPGIFAVPCVALRRVPAIRTRFIVVPLMPVPRIPIVIPVITYLGF
jgi:hypothetical protein